MSRFDGDSTLATPVLLLLLLLTTMMIMMMMCVCVSVCVLRTVQKRQNCK